MPNLLHTATTVFVAKLSTVVPLFKNRGGLGLAMLASLVLHGFALWLGYNIAVDGAHTQFGNPGSSRLNVEIVEASNKYSSSSSVTADANSEAMVKPEISENKQASAPPTNGLPPKPASPSGGGGGERPSGPPAFEGELEPVYPFNLLARGTPGSVTVAFMVNPDGRIGKIDIVESKPAGLFDNAVLAALSTARLQAGTFRPGSELMITVVFDPTGTGPSSGQDIQELKSPRPGKR